ncbi:MAG: nucleotide exchange factor GrpE [Candidatus Poribacteria bacterium]|nr:nucleotide exchange factor GrpE [Candidatus Poribacteria bacterium]
MSEAKKADTAENQEAETQAEDQEATVDQPSDAEAEASAEEAASESAEPEEGPSAEEFACLKAEYEERYDRMLRTIAEFENSKRRAERDKEDFLKYAQESLVKDLIPTVDSIEKAVNSTKDSKDFDALTAGIEMIHKQLLSTLEKRGVTPIDAAGELFDPTLHEAIMHIESEEVEENRVIQEFQRGYLLHSRVIRPSMVSVSKGKGEKEEVSDE